MEAHKTYDCWCKENSGRVFQIHIEAEDTVDAERQLRARYPNLLACHITADDEPES